MKLEVLVRGVGGGEPLVLDATLVVVRLDDKTPVLVVGDKSLAMRKGEVVAVAGDYGPDGVVRASHALDDDFNSALREMGIDRAVICDRLLLPQPPTNATLLREPR